MLEKPLAELVNAVFGTFGLAARTAEQVSFEPLMELGIDATTGDLLDQSDAPEGETDNVVRLFIGVLE